jgi:hypothetical protein
LISKTTQVKDFEPALKLIKAEVINIQKMHLGLNYTLVHFTSKTKIIPKEAFS